MEDPNDQQRRNRNQLKDVLQMSIANTPANDISRPNETVSLTAMDPERRAFLQNVLHNVSASSSVDTLKKCILDVQEGLKCFQEKSDNEETVSVIEDALERLIDTTGSTDLANDFEKLGGFQLLSPLLQTENEGIQTGTLELVAELVQNNPYCQEAALPLLPLLLVHVDNHPAQAIRIKALYALSCLLRQNKEAQEQFEASDGFSVLLRAIQGNLEKVRIKTAFLLSSLCNQRPQFKEVLCGMGFVEQLAALLHGEHDSSHEHMLSTLLALVSEFTPARLECQRPELGLEALLSQRLEILKGREEFTEELDYCSQLLDTCFQDAAPAER